VEGGRPGQNRISVLKSIVGKNRQQHTKRGSDSALKRPLSYRGKRAVSCEQSPARRLTCLQKEFWTSGEKNGRKRSELRISKGGKGGRGASRDASLHRLPEGDDPEERGRRVARFWTAEDQTVEESGENPNFQKAKQGEWSREVYYRSASTEIGGPEPTSDDSATARQGEKYLSSVETQKEKIGGI